MVEDESAVDMKQCYNDAETVVVKVRVKVTLEETTKAQRGSRGTTVLFL